MAKAAYKDLKIELNDGTALRDISQYVTSINGWNVERLVEEVTGASDTVDKWGALGFVQKNEVVLTGPYDDAAQSLFTIAKAWTDDSERQLKLTFATGDVVIVQTLLNRLQRNPERGRFHQVIATLRPTGAIT